MALPVVEPQIPKGVEHTMEIAKPKADSAVVEPQMPKGVEQALPLFDESYRVVLLKPNLNTPSNEMGYMLALRRPYLT